MDTDREVDRLSVALDNAVADHARTRARLEGGGAAKGG